MLKRSHLRHAVGSDDKDCNHLWFRVRVRFKFRVRFGVRVTLAHVNEPAGLTLMSKATNFACVLEGGCVNE